MKLAERWLPPLFVVVGAVIALAPKAPEAPESQHTICLELPLTPFAHVRADLEGCFAEYAERDPHDLTMQAWVIIEPVGTTARVVRRSPSPMLDLCIETVLDELGQSEDQHHEILLDLTWAHHRLELSETTRLRYTMAGLWKTGMWQDAAGLPARAEAAAIQALHQLQLAAAMNASPMTCSLPDPRVREAMRQRIVELRQQKSALERKIAKLRRRTHR
jgi:hypothetical protein